ncbi:MAG TPA: hypothetical protein ENN51_03965 [candidate division WOR-3 bacterium]|uniref:Uncharacterized protein n=1 Tax=candidate division WOR-3 bacterium TaxID=2052148 RepID=A0A7V0XF44_UNCW3|nr:hypothetical protein [candidate division WOR-3 bacterium]
MKRAYRHWSRDEVVREIRNLAERGLPLNAGHVARSSPALAYAARKYLGGWERAVAAAGLDYEKIRRKNFWSRQRILARIRELAGEGKPLHVSHAERSYRGLVGAAAVRYGSWGQAIRAAGLDYTKIKRQREWSKKVIVRELRRLRREGVDLSTTTEVRKKCRVLHAAAVRYFGSWAAAMRAARLERLLDK